MVARFHIDSLFDVTLTAYEVFAVAVLLLACLITAVAIRERSIRRFLKDRDGRRQKLGKVK